MASEQPPRRDDKPKVPEPSLTDADTSPDAVPVEASEPKPEAAVPKPQASAPETEAPAPEPAAETPEPSPMPLDEDTSQDVGLVEPSPPAAESPPPAPRRAVAAAWLWLLGALLAAGALGLWFGMSLGQREPSAQLSQTRPTLLIAQPKPTSPVPTPTPVQGSGNVSPSGSPTTPADYVVEAGDTLRSIALERYGDSEQWTRIYQANRALIGPNPDALQTGMRLRIPASDTP